MELLELVGLPDKADSYPPSCPADSSSVAIARALATHPKVLLCDEATSALDPNTTRQILELIRDINQKLNITVVVITSPDERGEGRSAATWPFWTRAVWPSPDW